MDDESSDQHPPHHAAVCIRRDECPHQATTKRVKPMKGTESWAKDKKVIVGAVAGLALTGLLSWGVWVTTSLFELRTTTAVAAAEAAAIRAQLTAIQGQLTDIQKELRQTQVHRP